MSFSKIFKWMKSQTKYYYRFISVNSSKVQMKTVMSNLKLFIWDILEQTL